MTGYEKSPDYGGEPPSLPSMVGALLFAAVFIGVLVALYAKHITPNMAADCWTLSSNEIEIITIDGKARASLDLRRIPKGECVTIRP